MRRKPGRTALAATSILCSLILAACNCAPTLRYVSVAPASATIFATAVTTSSEETTTTVITPCTTQQFAATAYYSDGSQKDISSLAGWSSSNTNAATIDTTGLASGASAVTAAGGTSIITATAGGASATANLAVDILTSITVTGPTEGNAVPLGGTQQYTATGTFTVAGGSTTTMDLTTQVAWSVTGGTTSADGSTNANSVASIGTATGLLTATGAVDSTTTVTASICTASGSTTVTVAAPAAQTLLISPRVQSIIVGQTIDFTAVVVNTDGSTTPVTLPLVWTSGTPAVASIISRPAGDGLATGLTAGETVITAQMGDGDTAITGSTTLAVSAAVARFAYVLNFSDGSVSSYGPHAATGAFTPLGKSSSSANQLIPHPSGMFVYSLNADNTISVLSVDPVAGGLSASAVPATPAVGTGTEFATVDPSGRWLYVVDGTSNMVFGFSINQSTGALTSIGAGIATGASPLQVLVAPNDLFVYVINGSAAGSVSAYSIGTGGALTALAAPTTVLNAPAFSAIDPASAYLFVPTSGDNTIVPFAIGTDGTLTAGTPFTFTPALTGTDFLEAVAVDPTSKFLYVVDAGTSSETTTTGNLYALSIGAGGALTQTINGGSPYALGNMPKSIALDPSGTILAVANNADNTVSVFTAAADGSLTPDNLVEAAGAPAFPVFINGAAETASSVSAVVAANITNSTLSAFTADSTGALTAVGTPFTALAGNSKVANIPFGTSVFTTSHTAKDLGGFNVDTTSATPFTQIAAPVVLPGAAGSVVVDATGNFAYVADTDHNTVSSVAVSSSTLGPVGASPVTVAGGVLSLASDPQTTLVYALGTNTITAIRALSTGTISLGPALTVTGTWTAGAVSPDGKYLVAVDSGTKTLTVFAITPVAGLGTDGTLTAVTGSTAIAIPGANTVSSVVFDPLNRGFAITDSGANSVTPFAITSAGAVTANTAVTTPTGATSAAVDPTGSFLFVGIYGDPTASTPVPGSVQAYTISSSSGSPALTAVGSPVNADVGTWGVGVLSTVQ